MKIIFLLTFLMLHPLAAMDFDVSDEEFEDIDTITIEKNIDTINSSFSNMSITNLNSPNKDIDPLEELNETRKNVCRYLRKPLESKNYHVYPYYSDRDGKIHLIDIGKTIKSIFYMIYTLDMSKNLIYIHHKNKLTVSIHDENALLKTLSIKKQIKLFDNLKAIHFNVTFASLWENFPGINPTVENKMIKIINVLGESAKYNN